MFGIVSLSRCYYSSHVWVPTGTLIVETVSTNTDFTVSSTFYDETRKRTRVEMRCAYCGITSFA